MSQGRVTSNRYTTNYFTKNRVKQNSKLIVVVTPEVPGCWIIQQCAKKGCKKQVGYWSKSGQKISKHYNAKCEAHQK